MKGYLALSQDMKDVSVVPNRDVGGFVGQLAFSRLLIHT
jgi:hypothetical protein